MLLRRAFVLTSPSPTRTFFTASCQLKSSQVVQESQDRLIENNKYAKPVENSNTKPPGWDEALPFDQVPGPKPYPLVGTMPYLIFGEFATKDFNLFTRRLNEKYGPICILKNFIRNKNNLFLFEPSYAEHLFRNEEVWPIRDGLPVMTHYRKEVRADLFKGNTGLATEQGEKWHEFRSIVNPILMQPRVAAQYIDSMDIVAEEFIEIMKRFSKEDPNNQMPTDFANELNKWALESICLVAIDKRLGCLNPNPDPQIQKLIDSVISVFDLTYKLDMQVSFWKLYATPDYKAFIKHFDFVNDYIAQHLDEAEKRIENSGPKPENKQSALEKLLKVNKSIAFKMAMDMMIAGIDTTSKTTGSVLYYLAANPKAQEALRKELKELMPEKNSPVTKQVLDRAQYLKACIKETQRFAPIGLGNMREIQRDMVIGGYQIPKGTQVMAANLLMSLRDFPQAKEFLPERWLRETKGELSHKNSNAFTSLPFGFGPRSCVGKRLANLEMEIIVARIIRNFNLEWHHPEMTFKQSLLYGFNDPLKLTVKEVES